jgi:transposase-like protein
MDEVPRTHGLDGSAHTTGRKSARSRPIEIITRGELRRSWTREQKREIVAESLDPELTPSEVARRHAISSGQLYTWRQQLPAMPGAVIERAMPRFAEVDLASASPGASQSGADRQDRAISTAGTAACWRTDRDHAAERRVAARGCRGRWPCAAPGARRAGGSMISLATGLRVYLACGTTDMRKGMLIALWRMVTSGEIPHGVVLRQAI